MAKGTLLKISGQAQGVGLRYAVYQYAQLNQLRGWIRNEPDNTVDCFLQNSEAEIKGFLGWLKKEFSNIERIDLNWQETNADFDNFIVKY